ncbi:NADH-FMN oxidoreductase RutF, flavin reductase (DIM6/NTAB) family [Tenacibaculum mesophilum]|uniref:Flavin oxidoreductase n=3 Tax=Tenacibaculum TaxID=104267 RepID=A0ABM7CHY7_9FLAO|nr:flavin oxidoreductase [Tenacibaculum mesophilum]QFS28665.1 flavin oxidoreductase [Tenacibaculum mesophilum]GFD81452.1 flavin oxidoreductase [Tenacibaculum sp. KUL118]SHF61240.1 NADH-FMN oxidoreductase RutF, flavin reductase (DIM6/NTAB) family [Tenacibaculum mesophilum]
MHITRQQIDEFPHLYKINLMNSISGYKPANLIATKSTDNITNVAVFSSVVHYGSSPAILGFVLRPTTVVRNTYNNIKETGYYTINAINKVMIEEAHHTSAKYPSEISEFDKTTLSEEFKNGFYAPFVAESPLQIGMKFLEEHYIKVNGTILVLGEVTDLYFKDSMLSEDGFLNLSKEKVAAINGLDTYMVAENYKRLSYQRPK